jgi:hypothetical protein
VLGVAASGGALVQVVRVGHSGSSAAWSKVTDQPERGGDEGEDGGDGESDDDG